MCICFPWHTHTHTFPSKMKVLTASFETHCRPVLTWEKNKKKGTHGLLFFIRSSTFKALLFLFFLPPMDKRKNPRVTARHLFLFLSLSSHILCTPYNNSCAYLYSIARRLDVVCIFLKIKFVFFFFILARIQKVALLVGVLISSTGRPANCIEKKKNLRAMTDEWVFLCLSSSSSSSCVKSPPFEFHGIYSSR